MAPLHMHKGFTLIEMVIVIIVLGVVGAAVAVFMKSPIDAYFTAARRAALSDEADTALRRMARDIRKALPGTTNAVNASCIEFVPTRTAGRYRTTDLVAGDGTALTIGAADSKFNMLGNNTALSPNQQIQPNDQIVVYYQTSAALVTGTVGSVAAAAESTITLTAAQTFPLASPNNRFYVIPKEEPKVSYVCVGGQLLRNPAACGAATAGASVVAAHLNIAAYTNGCNFQLGAAFSPGDALFQLQMSLINANEEIRLYHEVHADSSP